MKTTHAIRRTLPSIIVLAISAVLTITGLAITSPTAQAVDKPKPMVHILDYLLISPKDNTNFISTDDLKALNKQVSDGWARMSRGVISEMKIGQVISAPNFPVATCPDVNFDAITAALGHSLDTYNGQPNGHTLVIVGGDGSLLSCHRGGGSYPGAGLSSGGIVSVAYATVSDATVIAHELGHSFGLAHAGTVSQLCNTDQWDGPFMTTTAVTDPRFCTVTYQDQYTDPYNIMGAVPIADSDLNGANKYDLGIIQPGAGLIQATPTANEQLFTLYDAHTQNPDLPQSIRMTVNDPGEVAGCANPVYNIDYDAALGGMRVFHDYTVNGCGTVTIDPDEGLHGTQAWTTLDASGKTRSYFLPGEYQTTASGKVQVKLVSIDKAAGTATISIRRTDSGGFSSLQITSANLAASTTIGAAGGTLIGKVTTNQATWSASINQSWATVTPSGKTGQRLMLSVPPNTSTQKRTLTMTVRAGTETRVFTVAQDAGNPSLTDDCGGGLTSYCTWNNPNTPISGTLETAGDTDWFKFTAPAAGMYQFNTNPTTQVMTADGNPTAAKQAFLDAGQTCFLQVGSGTTEAYTVTATFDSTGIAVTPVYMAVPDGQSRQTVTVRTNGNWTFSGMKWVTASPSSGTGTTNVELTIQSNPDPFIRGGWATFQTPNLKSATVNLYQSPSQAPVLSVDQPSLTVAATGETKSVEITSHGPWQLTLPNWVSAYPSWGNGKLAAQTVKLTIQPNNTGKTRTESVRITGIASGLVAYISITQPSTAVQEILTVAPDSLDIAAGGDTQPVQVTASGKWTATGPSWVTASPPSGSGNTSVNLTTTANTTGQPRTDYVTFTSGSKTATVRVTQPAQAQTPLTVSPTQVNFPAAGGTQKLQLTADRAWFAIPLISGTLDKRSGTGNATLTLTMPPNNSSYPRNQRIYFFAWGKMVTVVVTQAGR